MWGGARAAVASDSNATGDEPWCGKAGEESLVVRVAGLLFPFRDLIAQAIFWMFDRLSSSIFASSAFAVIYLHFLLFISFDSFEGVDQTCESKTVSSHKLEIALEDARKYGGRLRARTAVIAALEFAQRTHSFAQNILYPLHSMHCYYVRMFISRALHNAAPSANAHALLIFADVGL
jgi:hypothetical protein